MGRGRAKAKQTKVARDLKYRTFETDFSSLERELRGISADDQNSEAEEGDYEDPYAQDDDDDDYPYSGRDIG